jgi:ribosomal protein S18 acetylase RimI-like enzyme
MKEPFFHVRGANPNDTNYLLDIDIKSFENPWSPEEWQSLGIQRDMCISVATHFGTPVGFAVFKLDQRDVVIQKLAVKPVARRQGVSRRLLDAANQYARDNSAEWLRLTIPESAIYPDHPNSLIDWLKAAGFKAITPFVKNHFTTFGNHEDGVQFISKLGEPHVSSYPH